MSTCIPSHRLKRSWHSCPRQLNAGNKNTPTMHHPRRRNVTTSMVGLKNGHICKNLIQNGEPQTYSWAHRRRIKMVILNICTFTIKTDFLCTLPVTEFSLYSSNNYMPNLFYTDISLTFCLSNTCSSLQTGKKLGCPGLNERNRNFNKTRKCIHNICAKRSFNRGI